MDLELAADAVCLKELRGHGVFQLPDHGDWALALKAGASTAAEELERGRQGAVVVVETHE